MYLVRLVHESKESFTIYLKLGWVHQIVSSMKGLSIGLGGIETKADEEMTMVRVSSRKVNNTCFWKKVGSNNHYPNTYQAFQG